MQKIHLDDVNTDSNAHFEMLYYSAQRTLSRLERKLHKVYGLRIPMGVMGEILKINHKLNQIAALWKRKTCS